MKRKRLFLVLGTVFLIIGGSATFFLLQGCAGDEECLAWGENCSQSYLQNAYGRTDIYCCEGQCATHGGSLTCGV